MISMLNIVKIITSILWVYSFSLDAASAQDWKVLINRIEKADLASVKDIVPSRIKIDEKIKGNKSILAIATFWLNKRKEALEYLLSVKGQASTRRRLG